MTLESMQAELQKTKQKEKQLVRRIQSERRKRIRELPSIVGLKTVDELLLVLTKYASMSLRSKLHLKDNSLKLLESAYLGAEKNGGSRPHFSAKIKERVKVDMQAGTKTIAQISEEHGPSVFTLRIWKRNWGLTKQAKRRK